MVKEAPQLWEEFTQYIREHLGANVCIDPELLDAACQLAEGGSDEYIAGVRDMLLNSVAAESLQH